MTMRESKRNQIMRSILPGMATILSITFAATLRVEHACTGSPAPVTAPAPALLYPYANLVAERPVGLLRVTVGAEEVE
jgi:hypothetical protein